MSKKEDLEKTKKLEALRKKSEEVYDAKRKRDLETKSTEELINQAEASWKKSHGRGFTREERQDARNEITVGKKYKDVSPIWRGNFNQNTPKNIVKTIALTQAEADRKNISEEFRKRQEEIKKKK